jgi:ABC-type transporter Mla subunit MlaD
LPYRPAASRIYVNFPQPVAIEVGAPVVYKGLAIGRVSEIRLSQPTPEEPAAIQLELAIESRDVVLRADDLFVYQSGGLIGEAKIEVAVPHHSSAPLPADAQVDGVPSLEDRISERAGEAVRRLGEAAREAGERIMGSFTGSSEAEEPEPPHDEEPTASPPGNEFTRPER